MSINKCPRESLQSFPIDIGFTLTESTYKDARKTPLNITFQWGTRASAPNFSFAGSGEIDHVRNDYLTTLKYNGSLFTLSSAQLSAPSHNRWLIPPTLDVTKLDNVEDVILTFERDLYDVGKQDDPKLIILVNPIFRTTSQNGNPAYLMNMANQVAAPVTLESMFPYVSSKEYVYYTTCVNGITPKDPYRNILVLLNVEGTLVSSQLMTSIKDMYNKFSEGDYPNYVPLGNYMLRSNKTTSLSHLKEGFQSANDNGVTSGNPESSSSAPTASYRVEKCVRFDPETQLGPDGTVILDSNKQPTTRINTIRENRAGIISSWSRPGTVSLKKAEEYFIYALVGILALFILYFIFNWMRGNTQNAGLFATLGFALNRIKDFALGIGMFTLGFMIGMLVIPASCPSATVPAVPAVPDPGSS